MEKQVVHLYIDADIGASGAVTAAKGGALTSVVKQATAGQYNLTLDSNYSRLLSAHVCCVGASATGVAAVDILQSPAAIGTAIKTTGALVLQCYDYAGAAVNPASGTRLKIKLEVRRSNYGPYD
jgi:hypothetical protein